RRRVAEARMAPAPRLPVRRLPRLSLIGRLCCWSARDAQASSRLRRLRGHADRGCRRAAGIALSARPLNPLYGWAQRAGQGRIDHVTDLDEPADDREDPAVPRGSAARTARLASLPLGMASRAVGGWGKRLTGRSTQEVQEGLSAKSAEQLFEVLGTLKGGAMKFGQALSVFEAAIPEEMAGPYREALTKLQTAAPPMSPRNTHRVLSEQLG